LDFNFFHEIDLVRRLVVAALIGLLTGMERGWHERNMQGGMRTAGIRTFTLIGLLAGATGLIARSLEDKIAGSVVIATAFTVVAVLFAWFRMRENIQEKSFGFTTVVAAMVTLLLGVYALLGDDNIAVAACVVMVVVLIAREQLHGLLEKVTWTEMRAAVILLAMTFLALPFIPDRSFGPYGGVNPRQVWLLAVVLAAVSFLGYVAVKAFGSKRGILISSAVGGLVSSTSVTVEAARNAQNNKNGCRLLGAGVALATAASLARMIAVITVLNVSVAKFAAVPLAVAILAAAGIAALLVRGQGQSKKPVVIKIDNPFSLQATLLLAGFLGAAIFVTEALAEWLGSGGALLAAFLGGTVTVDPATFSMAELARGKIAPLMAAAGLWVAALSNGLLKLGLALQAGPREFRWPLVLGVLAPILAGGIAAAAVIAFAGGPASLAAPGN